MSEREVVGWVDRVGRHGGVSIHEEVGGGRGCKMRVRRMVNLCKACVTGMMTEAGGRVASGLSANIAVGFDCIGVS